MGYRFELNCRSLFCGLNWAHGFHGLPGSLWVGVWFPWFELAGSLSIPILLVFLHLAPEQRLSISGIEDRYLAVGLALTQIAPPWFLWSFHLAHTSRALGILVEDIQGILTLSAIKELIQSLNSKCTTLIVNL